MTKLFQIGQEVIASGFKFVVCDIKLITTDCGFSYVEYQIRNRSGVRVAGHEELEEYGNVAA